MKKIMFIFVVLFLATPVFAEDHKPEEPKYEVKISITYNSVSKEKALQIVQVMSTQIQDACSMDVKIKKDSGIELGIDTGNNVIITDPRDYLQQDNMNK